MAITKRWQQVGAAVVVVCMVGLLWLMVPPRWEGPEAEPIPPIGFKRQCEITRDKHDVPHIKAPNLASAYYCWGRAHAADRGWQMDYLRRLGRGRVAEHYGGIKNVRRDFFMRLLDFNNIAHRWRVHLQEHQPRKYKLFMYYVWGINAGFAQLRRTKPQHPIYRKYGMRLEPWRMSDSMILLLLQSFSMTSMAFTNDLKHARLRLHLGTKRYHQLYGPDMGAGPLDDSILQPGEHYAVPPRHSHHAPGQPKAKTRAVARQLHPQTHRRQRLANALVRAAGPKLSSAERQHRITQLEAMLRQLPDLGPDQPGAVGSNSWVVGPRMTKRGYGLLANDTHMGITTPNFWHEAHIQTPKVDVTGFAVPGLPAIVLGHNRHLAWGMTAGQNNTADVMLIQPDRKGRFRMGQKQHQLHGIQPLVWMRKGPFYIPIFWQRFARSRLGPVLPLPANAPGKRFLMRWVTYHIKAPPLDMMNLMQSRTVKEADQHLRHMTLPNLSAVFADTKGNIGFRQYGLVAKRLRGVHGLLNVDDPTHRWQGFIPQDYMPWVINPPRNFIVTANNRPFPASYPYFLGHAYAPGFRSQRITSLLTVSQSHTIDTMKMIQRDVRVPMADAVLVTLLDKIKGVSPPFSALEKQAIGLLRKWSHKATKQSVGATIFRVWIEAIRERLFWFDRVKQPNGKGYDYPRALGLLRAIQGNIPIYTKQSLEQELRQALQETLQTLQRHLGKDPTKWTWGRGHRVYFRSLLGPKETTHPPPQGKDGDLSTVNVGHHSSIFPYENQYAASVRLIVELGPQIRSFAALAGQQKDDRPSQLTKEHKRWLNNQYRPRFFTPQDIQANKRSTTKVTY